MIQRVQFIPALWLLILLLYGRVTAQLPDYHVRLFDESDGIRTDIQHVIKDGRGFIWLTYSDHVQRFDGNQMEEFILDDRINSVITDQDQNLWITSRSQVYLYNYSSQGFSTVEVDRTKKIEIGSVLQLPGKPVWLLTNLGFYALDPQQSKFLPVENEKSVTRTPLNIRRNCSSQFDNTIFYSSQDTIWSHDVSTGIKRHLVSKSLLAMHAINGTQVLVSTWLNQSFLYDLQNQTIQSIHPEKYLSRFQDDFLVIHAVVNLEDNRYLLATTKGILEYHSTTGKLIQKQFYFKGQPISNVGRSVDLFLDGDRKIWACLENSIMVFNPFNEGIGLMRNSRMDQFNGVTSLIRNLAADENENLWISTSNGITYWDIQQNEFTSIFAVEGATDKMNHPSVRGIAFDGTYVIIGQANRGLWLYQPKTKKFRSPVYEPGAPGRATKERVEGDFIDHIHRLHSGDYFISARDGAYLLEKGSYLLRRFDFPGSQENLSFSYEDDLNQVWVGTEKNIHCLDSNLVYRFSVGEGIGPGMKRCLLQWKANEYILGAKGLYSISISGGKVTARTLNHFFDHIHINTIYKDHANRFWLATDRGLYRYTHEIGMVEAFDYFDNVQGDVYSGNSFYYNSTGMLFLGGANGINYFHPDKIQTRKDSLQVSLMKVTVNQDDSSFYNRASLLSLKPGQNSIEIEFIAPYFGNTNSIQYRYLLEGLTPTWNNVGHTKMVRFTSLHPGQYHFRIAASMNGIHWYECDDALHFNIAFPFWQTWWFITFSIAIIAASIFLLLKRRIRIIRHEETERRNSEVQLITINRDLASSQLTALRAQMNPHFIFNALNSVQRYILKGDVDQANKYLSKFSRLQREVLNNSNQDFITLEKEIEILDLYLQLERLRFDDQFEYHIIMGAEIDASEITIPPMILQPFIENAIWHGLMPRSGPKKVAIEFILHSDELLYCRICDNGIGRTASERLKNNHEGPTQHQSKGLSLVHERLRILEQLYQRPYQVEILDKVDPYGAVEGTEVNLTLHVGR